MTPLGSLPSRAVLVRAAALAVSVLACACGSRTPLDFGAISSSTAPSLPDDAPDTDTPAPSAGAGAASLPSDSAALTCESLSVTIDDLRPSVTLLIDRSGSMRSGYPTRGSEQTRWSIVHQALLDPVTGVVPSLASSLQFGLVFYTSHNGFEGGTCPILSEVRAATDNYESIRTLYDALSPDDDTPTGPALASVTRELVAANHAGPQVILLVTDGDPDSCEVPDPQTDGAQLQAITAAAGAYAAGIGVFVLGISADISGDKLQQLANAGQGRPLAARFGLDADAAEPFLASATVVGLGSQLREILARVPLCEVGLDRAVSANELGSHSSVTLDGQRLGYGSADGFQLSDPRHLRITGKACDALRAHGKRLSVRISCD